MFEIYSESRVALLDYMEIPLEARRQHLDLSKPCVEIGACSRSSRALLGMYLNTTCEGLGMKTGYLCHACGNEKCSNPEHLYWGTCSENNLERFIHDPKSVQSHATALKRKDPNHFVKIGKAAGIISQIENGCPTLLAADTVNARLTKISFSGINLQKHGWVGKVAKLLGVSHRCARQFVDNYYKGKTFKRR
jgi:hypothetical protein